MASVRFICGTNSVHKQLERELSEKIQFYTLRVLMQMLDFLKHYLQKEDTIISDFS